MSNTLKFSAIYALPVVAALLVTAIYAHAAGSKGPYVCKSVYALCSAAKCIPDPSNPGHAICFCKTFKGPNVSPIPCDRAGKKTGKRGVVNLVSTFSIENSRQGKMSMICPKGTPWTNCFGAPCTVDPTDPSKAICICPIVDSKVRWLTFGGDCDTDNCETGYWSGADVDDSNGYVSLLAAKAGVDTSVVKMCP